QPVLVLADEGVADQHLRHLRPAIGEAALGCGGGGETGGAGGFGCGGGGGGEKQPYGPRGTSLGGGRRGREGSPTGPPVSRCPIPQRWQPFCSRPRRSGVVKRTGNSRCWRSLLREESGHQRRRGATIEFMSKRRTWTCNC